MNTDHGEHRAEDNHPELHAAWLEAPVQRNTPYVRAPALLAAEQSEAGWEASELIAERFLLSYSGNTLDAYRRDLRDFAQWCAPLGLVPLLVERHHLERYQRYLALTRGLAAATVARRFSTVAGYLAYAVDDGVLPRNPVRGMRRVRVDNEPTSAALTVADVQAAFTAAESDARLSALVKLLFFTGMRISSVLGLDVENLGSEQGHRVARYRAKGGKRGVAVLPPPAMAALERYLGGRRSGPVFLGADGRRWNRTSAWRALRRLGSKVMPDRPGALHPHAWRAAFVSAAYSARVDTEDIRAAVLHADPRTTLRYLRVRDRLDRHPAHRLVEALKRQPPGQGQ